MCVGGGGGGERGICEGLVWWPYETGEFCEDVCGGGGDL